MAVSPTVNRHHRRRAGFTLLEVMIALAVFAVLASSVVVVVTQAVSNADGLQQRTYGMWVAENTLNELRLTGAPANNTYQKTVDNFGRQWTVSWQVENTQSVTYGPFVRRVTISVFPEGSAQSMAELTALLEVPLQ
ncbi:type II secretion system minor pseudopilin GspI [Salinispirillum marinum]|uniref:Type II secretion system protein I n=2 Tax=Saccharospirillaceae TaxID=255527 RepID=A0ABV8BGH3_9GAMM